MPGGRPSSNDRWACVAPGTNADWRPRLWASPRPCSSASSWSASRTARPRPPTTTSRRRPDHHRGDGDRAGPAATSGHRPAPVEPGARRHPSAGALDLGTPVEPTQARHLHDGRPTGSCAEPTTPPPSTAGRSGRHHHDPGSRSAMDHGRVPVPGRSCAAPGVPGGATRAASDASAHRRRRPLDPEGGRGDQHLPGPTALPPGMSPRPSGSRRLVGLLRLDVHALLATLDRRSHGRHHPGTGARSIIQALDLRRRQAGVASMAATASPGSSSTGPGPIQPHRRSSTSRSTVGLRSSSIDREQPTGWATRWSCGRKDRTGDR